jgi:hypothetical protein
VGDGWMKEEAREEQEMELVVISVTSYLMNLNEHLWFDSILIF